MARKKSEHGAALMESLLGTLIISAGLLLFFQHYQAQVKFRHHALSGKAVERQMGHITARMMAANPAHLPSGEDVRHLEETAFQETGFLGAHMAGTQSSAIIQRRDERRFDLFYFPHGREQRAAGDFHAHVFRGAAKHREWIATERNLPAATALDSDLVPDDVSHGFHSSGLPLVPVYLHEPDPDNFPRAWSLQGVQSWWLHPHYMPVLRDMAEKLRDGWELREAVGAGDLMLRIPDISCQRGTSSFHLALPEAAIEHFEVDTNAASRMVIHDIGPRRTFVHNQGTTRLLRLQAVHAFPGFPVRFARTGDLSLLANAGMLRHPEKLWLGWAVEGVLDFTSAPVFAPPEYWKTADAPQNSLWVSSSPAKLIAGYVFNQNKLGAPILVAGNGGAPELRQIFSSLHNPRWKASGNRWHPLFTRRDWTGTLLPHAEVHLTIPERELRAITAKFEAAGAIIDAFHINGAGRRVEYHQLVGNQVMQLARFQQIYEDALPHAFSFRYYSVFTPQRPEGADAVLVITGSKAYHADRQGVVAMPAPAVQIPQAVNLNELIMDCDSSGDCTALGNAGGVHEIARNDPQGERGKRPDGALHFGKVKLHLPREAMNIVSFCTSS